MFLFELEERAGSKLVNSLLGKIGFIISLSVIIPNTKTTFSAGITVRSRHLFNQLRKKGAQMPPVPLPPGYAPALDDFHQALSSKLYIYTL